MCPNSRRRAARDGTTPARWRCGGVNVSTTEEADMKAKKAQQKAAKSTKKTPKSNRKTLSGRVKTRIRAGVIRDNIGEERD